MPPWFRLMVSSLLLCYPIVHFDLSLLCDVYSAAHRFKITKMTPAIKPGFGGFLEHHSNLVSFYCTAVEQGWHDEALAAARVIAKRGIHSAYASEMENSSATPSHHLLGFYHDSVVAAAAKLTSHAPHYTVPNGTLFMPLKSIVLLIASSVLNLNEACRVQVDDGICSHGRRYDRHKDTTAKAKTPSA